jgi:hypothetical protein
MTAPIYGWDEKTDTLEQNNLYFDKYSEKVKD